MSDDVKALAEGLNKAFEAMKVKNDQIETEVKKLGSADFVARDELKRIDDALAKLDAKNDQIMLAQKRAERSLSAGGDDIEAKAAKFGKVDIRAFGKNEVAFDAKSMGEYKDAIGAYLRGGQESLTDVEKKALAVGGDATGGYVVHPDMSGRTVAKVFETSVMRAYAASVSISTDSYEGLYDNDEAGYGWTGETSSRPQTTTPVLGKWAIPVHEVYANPAATQKIIDDAEINIEQWLADKVAARFARAENAAFVNGDGVAAPRGFLTYADGTDLTNSIERVKTGVSGDFAADPAGLDALLDMTNIKAPYLANANWFMNRYTRTAARKLKTSDGAYLWQPSVAAGTPATLLGYSVAAAMEDMPSIAAGSLSIAFGDMRSAYQIVDRVGIRTLRDPYTAKPYVLFYSTKRVGGDVIDGAALRLLQFSV